MEFLFIKMGWCSYHDKDLDDCDCDANSDPSDTEAQNVVRATRRFAKNITRRSVEDKRKLDALETDLEEDRKKIDELETELRNLKESFDEYKEEMTALLEDMKTAILDIQYSPGVGAYYKEAKDNYESTSANLKKEI